MGKGPRGPPLNEQAHALAQLACTLPLDADGQPARQKRAGKKELRQLELVDVPFHVVPSGQAAALILSTGENCWSLQLSGPLGSSSLEGTVEGNTTVQHRLYAAIQAGLLALPPTWRRVADLQGVHRPSGVLEVQVAGQGTPGSDASGAGPRGRAGTYAELQGTVIGPAS